MGRRRGRRLGGRARRSGRGGRAARGLGALLSVPVLLVGGAACRGGGADDAGGAGGASATPASPPSSTAAPGPTALPRCADSHHVVVFDVFGGLTLSDGDLQVWMADATDAPDPRAGIAELAWTYRGLGYEILYITTAPARLEIGGVAVVDAITGWLQEQGLPTGEGTRVWAWDGRGDGGGGSNPALLAIVQELLTITTSDGSVDAAYTDNDDKAQSLANGGVDLDRLFTLGTGAGAASSTPVPGDDLVAHVATVRAFDRVCQA